MNTRIELNDNMMELVNGGTFTSDTYPKKVYEYLGVGVTQNWIYKNEFSLPDGTKTDMEGADRYLANLYTLEEVKVAGNYMWKIKNKSTGVVVYIRV